MRGWSLILLSLVAFGCRRYVVSCESDERCRRNGVGGVCLPALGARYCAFVDPACPSGLRWDESAAEQNAGTCTGGDNVDGGSTLDLSAPDAGGLLQVSPESITLAAGWTQRFVADREVSWSALRGTVSASGLYTAPTEAGDDEVQATGEGQHVTAHVAVRAMLLDRVAGQIGQPGSNDGTGSGTPARFKYPKGIVSDGAGNLYVAEWADNTVRRVEVATGAVETIAGTAGTIGTTDAVGGAARFSRPCDVTLVGGNLYVSDAGNHTIRQIDLTTRVVSTLAGGPDQSGKSDGVGSDARFNVPSGVATDGAGLLFVADSKNATIRQIDLATRAVTTLAGTAGITGSRDGVGPFASFSDPSYLAHDRAGHLYVSETENSIVRVIELATRNVRLLAGAPGQRGNTDGTGGAARFIFPVSLVVGPGNNLLVADTAAGTIRRIILPTAEVSTVVGTDSGAVQLGPLPGRLNNPTGLAIGAAGEILIADGPSHAILVVRAP